MSRSFFAADVRRIHLCDMTHVYVRHDSFVCTTRLNYMCDIIHWCARRFQFRCAIWCIHMCDMTHSYVRRDSFICATWLIHMCDMTHSYVRHDSFICATWLIHIQAHTHAHMRWLWSVGSIKLYVSFAKEPYKRNNLLQKRSMIESIQLTEAIPHPPTQFAWRSYTSLLQNIVSFAELFCKRDL